MDNFLKEFPTHLINFVIASGLLISLFSHLFYKSNVKWKHKQLKLSDDVSKLLQSFIKIELFVPVIFAVLLWVASDSKEYNMLLIFAWIYIILFGVAMIYFYIRTTKKVYGINNLNGMKKKITRVIFRYILVLILIAIITFLNLALISSIKITITDFKAAQEPAAQIITAGVLSYILNIIIIWGIYSIHVDGLTKGIRYVKIFYTQGKYINKDRHVKFEDFEIDKNYLSYLNSKGVKKVIPTKDLLRIEYVYK